MYGDIVSQFVIDIRPVTVVKVTGVDSCVRDPGALNEELGDCLWPRDNNGAHTTSAAAELNSLKMFLNLNLSLKLCLVCLQIVVVVNWKTIALLFQQLALSHH